MGIIADHFAAEIKKMKARHEAEAIRTERHIRQAQQLLDELKSIDEDMARELA